jgi:hypothetical protein
LKFCLGNPTLPAPAIYGIAFTLAWDPLLTDSTTASFDFSTTSLGIPGMDMITFQHRDFSLGKVDVTMSRTDHANILLADSVVAEFSIRVAATAPLSTLEFELANVKALTSSEEELNFNLRSDSVVINPSITGIPPVDEPIAVSVFPVPARDRLMVKSASVIHSAVLFNALGERILFREFHRQNIEIATRDLPGGIYLLQLNTASGWVTKKVLIHR